MIRKIIKIDEEKCNGCGICAQACHEGAIGMVNNKAKLLREDYCDGLGDCLPACPANAISFEFREAPAYNEAAVLESKKSAMCPETASRKIVHTNIDNIDFKPFSRLQNFPIQIKLVPVSGAMFDNSDLLIAADCTAYAYGDFHNRFIKGRTAIIGCPKLDNINYAEKLSQILRSNSIKSVTLVRMQVPCCAALARALETAIALSGSNIPVSTHIIAPDGHIAESK